MIVKLYYARVLTLIFLRCYDRKGWFYKANRSNLVVLQTKHYYPKYIPSVTLASLVSQGLAMQLHCYHFQTSTQTPRLSISSSLLSFYPQPQDTPCFGMQSYDFTMSMGTRTCWLDPLYWVVESSQQFQDQRQPGADIAVYHPAWDDAEFHYGC